MCKCKLNSVGAVGSKMNLADTAITVAEVGIGVGAAEYASMVVKNQFAGQSFISENPKAVGVVTKLAGAAATGWLGNMKGAKKYRKHAWSLSAGMAGGAILELLGVEIKFPDDLTKALPGISGVRQLGRGTTVLRKDTTSSRVAVRPRVKAL